MIEEDLPPTRELEAKHRLGDWVKKDPEKGRIISQAAWDAGYSDNSMSRALNRPARPAWGS